MKKILISIILFILAVVVGLVLNFLVSGKNQGIKKIKVGNVDLKIEIAADAAAQIRGLSGRASLPKDQGMLFIFNGLATRSFWMAGMKFPLDLIWIRGDEVVGFSENLPPAAVLNTRVYNSPEPVDKVLEINAGLVKELGIGIGDKMIQD